MPILMYWLLSKYSITPNNWQETQKGSHFHAVVFTPPGVRGHLWPLAATRGNPQGDEICSVTPHPSWADTSLLLIYFSPQFRKGSLKASK